VVAQTDELTRAVTAREDANVQQTSEGCTPVRRAW
jgi:hypothetical protein